MVYHVPLIPRLPDMHAVVLTQQYLVVLVVAPTALYAATSTAAVDYSIAAVGNIHYVHDSSSTIWASLELVGSSATAFTI